MDLELENGQRKTLILVLAAPIIVDIVMLKILPFDIKEKLKKLGR
jgi:hypothetical protein